MNLITFRFVKYVLVLLTMLFSAPAAARVDNWSHMVLNIKGIEAGRGGLIHIFVFLDDGFPIKHEKALKSYVQPVGGMELSLAIEAPADIPFALKVHHDEDGNSKVTKNWTGLFPAEGFGFSSGAKLSFGPPSFARAKMTMPKGKAASITMRYP